MWNKESKLLSIVVSSRPVSDQELLSWPQHCGMMSSLFHKHLWKFREGGEKNTFGKKYHRMQVKDFFQSCFFFFFFLSLSFFLNLAAAPPEGENQVKIQFLSRLVYCWMWKMADLKLFLRKLSSIGDYLLPPLSLFPCPKTKANNLKLVK